MSLRNLHILVAIAAQGSFAKAAEHLGLTQSAVSLQIKNLEEELGVPLFERSGRSPRLNASGRLVVERAEEILAIYDGIREELVPANGRIGGVLTLGVVPTVLTGPLPPVLGRLRKRYEHLQVRLVSGLSAELFRKVEDGELDAALTTEPPYAVPPRCEWSVYDEEPFFVAAPRGSETSTTDELFGRFPFVRFDKTAWAGAMVNSRLIAQGIQPRDVMEVDSLEATLSLVKQGLGIAVVPLNRKRLVQARKDFGLIGFGAPQLIRRMGMYQKQRHPRHALTEPVLEELRRECKCLIKY
ncbi:LysR family transcriptional regulator [Trichlorobacter ammonificans]|uniref:LysR family transcriptional regulator n=1 Tax=Trichlorobacter ammonificans TaxID=2916410 RepID=A0ABN8HIB3_9BACT|nr:LysR family transcriptional regulator [Trichlorobacter ammonificans]CAH2032550.1 LysR family transcriptional regulator [Trichlorobacter ammonificans]